MAGRRWVVSRDTFFDALRVVVFVIVVIAIVVVGIVWADRKGYQLRQEYCVALGERLGYETELIAGYCYIKVRPGLKIREDLVLDFLPVIDCR